MKKLLIILITLQSCISFPEAQPETGSETVTIIFEQGQTWFEKQIINNNQIKINRLNLSAESYSHCKIMIDSMVWETHPKHGVICNRYTEGGHPELRDMINISVPDTGIIRAKLEHADSTANKYDKKGALFSGIYTFTGVYFTRETNDIFYCSELVAYALDVQDSYKYDIVDVWALTKKMEK